jgi:3-oxoadipate enol-lactonase
MPFISLRDIRMYYEIHGSGPRLLFFSGTGGDLRRKPNIFLSPLSKNFEILAHDQRGLGQTDRPEVPYSMADYAMDADSLLKAIGWEGCLVMGVSFGGMVAQEFALSYPHRVDRLVLACTSSGGAGGDSYPLHEFSDFSPEERALRVIPISDTRRDKAWQSANPDLFKKIVDDTLAGARIGEDEPGRKIGAQRQLEARMGHNTYERLPNLKMPVYICGGLYDGIAPKANLEAIHKQIPKSHLEFFEGGHLFLIQDKRAYARIVAFLKGELNDDS